MQGFIVKAAMKAMKLKDEQVDPTPDVWANRAFAVISLIGGRDEVDGLLEDNLASLLAIAPSEVVAGGTAFLQYADAVASMSETED